MKPFDLEKALAGEPVITRDGRPVKIAGYNSDVDEDVQVLGWLKGLKNIPDIDTYEGWYADGHYAESENELDLFMASTKKTGWVNLYRNREDKDKIETAQEVCVSQEEALDNYHSGIDMDLYITTVKIEWEE